MTYRYRIGADENGLGARLGPLVVTAVLARLDETAHRRFERRLPKRLRLDLDDSKRLVSHRNSSLGEAWARVLADDKCRSPEELLRFMSLDKESALLAPCPKHVTPQCWTAKGEAFTAEPKVIKRIFGQRATLYRRGVEIVEVKSVIVCTRRLNQAKARGLNRFISDLHAMERLALNLRQRAGENLLAVCGKVGGMNEYDKFFGPLSGFLHSNLEQGRGRSAYHFPQIGELRFIKDADASDPLVMLASLCGKYVRELLMGRIGRYYLKSERDQPPSGYHDPVTARFIDQTEALRDKRRIPLACFERSADA